MKNTIIKDTIILTLITLVSGGLLGLVYQVTKEPIAQQEEMAKQEAYQAVFEDADSFEVCVEAGDADIAQYLADNGFTAQTVNEVMEAKDASGETIGY
ncbi:MAG TPA: FMN-binding protein, partial [Candidatus Blautia avicola]|nr:FMN-binding protein [Candidatus Blautia avicola]